MLVLGICGGSGSGKTALADALSESLQGRTCVLSQDAYYLDRSGWSEERSRGLSFDEPASLDLDRLHQDVRALAAGRSIEVPTYCFETHSRLALTRRQDATDYLIVEGTLILSHATLREVFDLSIFLDVPADVRFIRRMGRDVRERGRTVASVVAQYLDTVRPMHERFIVPQADHADRVIDALELPLQALVKVCRDELDRRRR